MADTRTPDATQLALSYFQAPENYFWRWAERHEIVEWPDGATICYREELQVILETVAPAGLPPLGAGLLLLAACADRGAGHAGGGGPQGRARARRWGRGCCGWPPAPAGGRNPGDAGCCRAWRSTLAAGAAQAKS